MEVSPGVLAQETERVVVAGLAHRGSTPEMAHRSAGRAARPAYRPPPGQLASPAQPQ